MTTTPTQLSDWRKLAEAATPGLWISTKKREIGVLSTADDQSFGMVIAHADADSVEDATFIAAAREAVPALLDLVEALTAERDEAKVRQVDWQEGCPARPYGEAWFLAVMASGDRVVLRELPEEYAYDFKTADDTYVKRENVNRWAQFPDSEFLFPREKLADAESALTAARAERDVLREVLEPIVTEFLCTIKQYHKIGPDFTHKDGTEVFAVQSILNMEPLIEAARAALSGKEEI